MQSIRFSRQSYNDFHKVLKQRINGYFKDRNISTKGNWSMYFKTFAMYTMYLAPFVVILTVSGMPAWLFFSLWGLMGIGMAGIGFSVMHDACHESYSSKKWVNNLLALSMNVTGASYIHWKIKHNVLHHSYTNVDGVDEDINSPEWLLRFSPSKKQYKIHRFQHLYAWFLYSFLSISWMTQSDFTDMPKYTKKGLYKTVGVKPWYAYLRITGSKIFYFGYILVLPWLVTDYSWWIIVGFVVMLMVSGFLLSIVFQPAHVMESSEFYDKGTEKLDHTREEHQLLTTTNFGTRNKILTWFVGGLNFQIEHHLFPNICHVHYKEISKIVKNTAKECGIPYNEIPTFRRALLDHGKMLKKLGRA